MMAAERFTGQPGSTVPLKGTIEAFDKTRQGRLRPPARSRRSSSSVASTTWRRRPKASAAKLPVHDGASETRKVM